MKRLNLLKEENILGHDVFLQIDPVVAKTLVAALKVHGYRLDKSLDRINRIFPTFDVFGYRVRRGKIRATYGSKVDWATVYHEGFHNLVAARYGTKLRNRPRITLLNECMGQGLGIYFSSVLAQRTTISVSKIPDYKKFVTNARILRKPLKQNFKVAVRDPFAIYKKAVVESFALNKKVMSLLSHRETDIHRIVEKLNSDIRKSKTLIFFKEADMTTATLFVAANCGLRSDNHDLRAVRDCMKILRTSSSMDELVLRLSAGQPLGRIA